LLNGYSQSPSPCWIVQEIREVIPSFHRRCISCVSAIAHTECNPAQHPNFRSSGIPGWVLVTLAISVCCALHRFSPSGECLDHAVVLRRSQLGCVRKANSIHRLRSASPGRVVYRKTKPLVSASYKSYPAFGLSRLGSDFHAQLRNCRSGLSPHRVPTKIRTSFQSSD